METQMTLMKMTDVVCDDLKARIGIDRAKGTYPGYHYMRLTLGEFIRHRYKVKDLAFGQLTEQFIHDYQAFATEEKGYAIDTVRHHLAILKKICRLAYKKGYSEKCHFQHFALPKQSERTPRALSRESFEKIRDVEIPAYRNPTCWHVTCSCSPATRAYHTPMRFPSRTRTCTRTTTGHCG